MKKTAKVCIIGICCIGTYISGCKSTEELPEYPMAVVVTEEDLNSSANSAGSPEISGSLETSGSPEVSESSESAGTSEDTLSVAGEATPEETTPSAGGATSKDQQGANQDVQVVYVPVFEDPSNYRDFYFSESTLVYTYKTGVVYQIVTTPNFITDIMLEPGEFLVSSPAAGDTDRWILGEASSGEGSSARTHIYVKPLMLGLKTNYIVATNRRVYHLDLTSSASGGMRSVRWNYSTSYAQLSRPRPAEPQPVVTLDQLQWNYTVKTTGGKPMWSNIRVATNGEKSYIFFPYKFTQGEAPVLYAKGKGSDIEIINYRVYDNYYEADQFLLAGELRGGKEGNLRVSFYWED